MITSNSRDERMTVAQSSYLSIKLTRYLVTIIGFWTVYTRKEKLMLRFNYFSMLFILSISITNQMIDLYYCRHDLYDATYTASTAIPLLIATVKAITFTVRKSELTWLLEHSQKYFWYKEHNAFEKRIMDKLNQKSMLYMGSYTFFLYGTAVIYAVYPLFANIGKTGEDRILPFHFRLFEIPSTRTPYFEVIFGIEVISTLHSGFCFCCFDNLLCILTLHIGGQFKILQNRLETIFGNFSERKSFEIYEQFKECVMYHHMLITYVEKLECVFCFPLMFQLLMSSIVLCLSGFQLTMASEEFVKKYLFLSYAISGIVQVYMITQICDDIMEESSGIGNAIYSCNWERTSYIMFNKFRKDMIIVMIRTKYPCYLTAAKFFPISLRSFTNVMSTTASYFTLLQTMDE